MADAVLVGIEAEGAGAVLGLQHGWARALALPALATAFAALPRHQRTAKRGVAIADIAYRIPVGRPAAAVLEALRWVSVYPGPPPAEGEG